MIRKAHTVLLLRPFFHLFQFPVPFENDVVNRALRIVRIIAMIVVEGNADSFRRIHKTCSFPQLGIRIIGEVTAEKVKMVQDADAIWREEIDKAGIAHEIGQYFAALTNMRSVGVMGDERTYDYAIALRAVTTTDFMTAESAEISS